MRSVGRTGKAVGVGALGLEIGTSEGGIKVLGFALIGRVSVYASDIVVTVFNGDIASDSEVAFRSLFERRGALGSTLWVSVKVLGFDRDPCEPFERAVVGDVACRVGVSGAIDDSLAARSCGCGK